MNRFAYLLTCLAIQTISSLSKAKINLHGQENIPHGSRIYVINHFTRMETLFLPYNIFRVTGVPIWSLTDNRLFQGAFGAYLEKIGAVSTSDPDRDLLIVKTLLTGEADWIIYPEGRMVKNKKIFTKNGFLISYAGKKHKPHSGAATLALRTEFYRQRLRSMVKSNPEESRRIMDLFEIDSIEYVSERDTYIVPVNITYYPIRAMENLLSRLADYLLDDIQERVLEEIMTEGTMLLSGVDVDIRFGEPLKIKRFMGHPEIEQDISAKMKINFEDDLPSKSIMQEAAIEIMQCYMAEIYRMTTVNYDHIIASLIKKIPFKRIDERDLKRRVFLATGRICERKELFLHNCLCKDSLHIITDDRYGRFHDFVTLAAEKGVLIKAGDALIKKTSRFSVAFLDSIEQGHTIRIDNPVSVIANEVEPLTLLQKILRPLSWQPSSRLRKKIVKKLLKKAFDDFEADYDAFYVKGETKGKEVGRPYLIKGKKRKIGVLLIHGYMAAPLEVKGLAKYLCKKGLYVYAPRLKGHGTSPDDLAIRTYQDWVESVDEGYAIINNLCERVVIGGFSSGAGLALDLACRVKNVEGVFAICPPLRLQDFSVKLIPAVDIWNKLMAKIHIDGAKKIFIENEPECPGVNYYRNPVSGVRELECFMDGLESKLSEINTPVLVIQASGDPVVAPGGSRKIFELLGSEKKEYMLMNFERHCIVSGEGSERVYRAIENFIAML
ncbi:MAG: alpha/beta fold hydrolase [Desulfosarcina sp.]|nr:alpha/beta fold hydrolase [Desulfobacterales bacterium]